MKARIVILTIRMRVLFKDTIKYCPPDLGPRVFNMACVRNSSSDVYRIFKP
jgi:hypothetical protein